MRIKSFIASTVQAALANVKREMGDSSIILETRNIEEGDIKSKAGQKLVEIVAAENISGRYENRDPDNNMDQRHGQDVQSDNDGLNPESSGRHQSDVQQSGQHSPKLFQVRNGQTFLSGNRNGNGTLADHLSPEDLIEMADLPKTVRKPDWQIHPNGNGRPDQVQEGGVGQVSESAGDQIIRTGDSVYGKSVSHAGLNIQSDKGNLNSQLPGRHQIDSSQSDQDSPKPRPTGNGRKDKPDRQMDSDILADYLLSEDLAEMTGFNFEEKSVPLVSRQNSDMNDGWTEISKELYKQLRIQQVEKEHSRILINEALSRQNGADSRKIDVQRLMIRESIMNKIKIPAPDSNSQEQCKTMAFIGAAGTGKTTTILKLASDIEERSDKDILLISIRGDFTGKLNKISGSIEATVLTASTPQELREIIDEYGSNSHIFIDTPGVNHFDKDALSSLKEYLDEIPDLETHLVVSAATRYIDIINIVKKFDVFPVHRLLFTKIDETDLYGTLFSVTEQTQIPLSYVTDGQEIPDDIRPATAEMVAEMVMRI